MFNSTRITESPRIFKTSLINTNDETVNETAKSFVSPKITSTPLNSMFATPPKSRVLTPRRYSLSEVATPPRTKRREFVCSNSQYPPGPLLASTKYNVNVSTFEDVKSPGLASRIVQYNLEAEREKEQQCPATHQAKYGSLGLFPIVHLFKKKLPLLEQKPRHVTVRVASPDYMKHNPEYNRRLLEGIVKPSGSNVGRSSSSFSENPASTRSVLDALKEISRKRIHASEEIELPEDNGKRLRTESEDFTDSNKRTRDESPLLDAISPTRPASKKICMYDEYTASCSSMDLLNKTTSMVPKRKSISISTTTDNPKESKQVKLINAETQTIPVEEPNESSSEKSKEDESEGNKNEKIETVLKVFDDAPLERIRKNRLAALMGTLVGKDPVLEPKPNYTSLLDDSRKECGKGETDSKSDKSLVSILAPNKKSPIKSTKHVHFDIPDVGSKATATASTDKVNEAKCESAVSTSSIIAPVSTTVTNAKSTQNLPNSTSATSELVISKPVAVTTSVTTCSPPKVGGFKFDLAKPASATSESTLNVPSMKTFSLPIASSTVSPRKKSEETGNAGGGLFGKTSSPFSIEIGKPSDATSKPSFSFSNFSKTPPTTNPTFTFGGTKTDPASTTSASVGAGVSSSANNPTVTTSAKTSFTTLTSVSNKGLITSASVTSNFGNSSPSVLPSFSTGGTSISTTFAPSTGTGSFGKNNGVAAFGTPTTSVLTGFGTTVSSANGGFRTTASATSGFGAGVSSAISGFGTVVSSANGGFGIAASSATTGFGTTASPATSNFGISTTTSSGGFGAPKIPGFNASATPGFSAVSASNVFGTSSLPAAAGFGIVEDPSRKNATAAFPSTTNSGFGAPTTCVSNFGGVIPFGTSTNFTSPSNTAFGFGNATTTSSVSGTAFGPVTTTASSGFGTTTASAFGTTTAPAFGTTTAPAFGTTTAPAFGTTTAPAFGTTTASAYGTNSAPLFGNPSFGTSSSATASFGSTNSGSSFSDAPSPFGGSAPNVSVFGSTAVTTAPSFVSDGSSKIFGGTSAGFGAPTTTTATGSIFGNGQIPFGNSATTPAPTPTFSFTGKTTSSNTFGTTSTTTASFGTGFGQNTSVFGGGSQQSSGFGTVNKTPIFGNSNNAPAFGGAPASGFGGSQPQQQPFGGTTGSVFSKPQSSSQNAFSSPQFSFSQQQQPQQTNSANSSFVTTSNQSGVFAFGSGGAEKPAAFNFSAAAASTEAPKKFDFTGSSNAPAAFGTSFGAAPSVPSFGAATPVAAGGFSIGAGPPSSNRPRTLIKGKRRT